MIVQLWNFSKKHNSTARPTGNAYNEFDIYFKRNTTLNAPIFMLDTGGEFPQYNYAVIPSLHMYYYIEDVGIGNNDIFELICRLDYLATARPYIKSSSAFVKYSSSNFDKYIKDDRIQPTAEVTTYVENNSWAADITEPTLSSSYCYVLTTLNKTYGVCHYLISQTVLNYLTSSLVDNATSITGALKEVFYDAKSSILKLQIIPWSRDALQRQHIIGSNAVDIELGGYVATGITGYVMDANATYNTDDDIIYLPDELPDDFTGVEPYCEAKISFPLLGVMDLPLSELRDVKSVKFKLFCNVASGAATLIMWKGTGAGIEDANASIIATLNGSVNAEIPLGFAVSANPTGIAQTGVGVAAAIAGEGAMTIGGIAAAVASFSSFFAKSASVIGAFGGNSAAYGSKRVKLSVFKRGLTEDPANMKVLYGRPCGKVLSLANLTGYCETSQFQLQAPLDDETVQEVNRLMDSGVYLE